MRKRGETGLGTVRRGQMPHLNSTDITHKRTQVLRCLPVKQFGVVWGTHGHPSGNRDNCSATTYHLVCVSKTEA